jgi:hypothetical protein
MMSQADKRIIMNDILLYVPESDRPLLLKQLQKQIEEDVNFNLEMMNVSSIADALWRFLFDFKSHETVNRKFMYNISTNGYAVTLRYGKPVMTGVDGPKKRQRKSKIHESDRTDQHDIEDGYDMFPCDVDGFETFIGIDPGQTYPMTAFHGVVNDEGRSEITKVSTNEWRSMAKITAKSKWELRLREREPAYQEAIANVPSMKTSILEHFNENVTEILRVSGGLLDFRREKPFRKWEFTTKVEGMKATVALCKKITNGQRDKKKILIGLGDWSQQDGVLKGKPKAPVKKWRRELRNYATVVRIDEYRTSKTCSCCHHEGDVKGLCRMRNLKLEKKMKDGTKKLVKCHEVVRCNNESCKKTWQRDVNASRNIRILLMAKVRGEERPRAFARKIPSQT